MIDYMPNFEVFTRKYAKVADTPTLTVTVRGTLNLNEAAFHALGSPEAVALLYSREEAVIGLRPEGKDHPNAYRVGRLGTAGKSWTIVAKDFCAWIGVDLSEARRYPLTAGDGGIGCVDLRGNARVVTGNRNRKR